MPTLGGVTELGESATGQTAFGFQNTANNNNALQSTPTVISLVPDETFQPDAAGVNQVSLRDFTEGQDWFLKRIVGKCTIRTFRGASGTSWHNLFIAAAFFVARAQDDNQELPDLTVDEYDPLNSQNVRQPWIWRRTWQLSTGAPQIDPGVITAPPPNMNQFGPGLLDGPHIDAKTARRIRREERLWFVINCSGFDIELGVGRDLGAGAGSTGIFGELDYRVLSQMRRSTNRSTF